MKIESPIDTLAAALHAACLRDLPDIEYVDRDWDAYSALSGEERKAVTKQEIGSSQTLGPVVHKRRRPDPKDCEVVMFPQMWASSALGYGGMGGAVMTSAYTVIVRCTVTGCRAVYFGGSRLAYLIPHKASSGDCERCIAKQVMPSVADAAALGWVCESESTQGA